MTKNNDILKLEKLSKTYLGPNERRTLDQIDLSITKGSTVALTGESGSGKSTLLNILAGLEPPTSGEVYLNQISIWNLSEKERSLIRRNELAVIFQSFNLIHSLTIWENISFQARLSGKWDKTFVQNLIDLTGLEELKYRYPEEISGGEQQRVAILRAIASKPKLLLADEPTGNLDDKNSEIVMNMLIDVTSKIGSTLVVATHSEPFASRLDLRLRLKNGKIH